MANFTPSKKTASDFNNGTKYVDYDVTTGQNGDEVQADTINNLVESQLWSQGMASNTPVVTQDTSTGRPSTKIQTAEDGTPRLNFVNIKGQSIYATTSKFDVRNNQVIADAREFQDTYRELFPPNIGDIIMDVDGKIGVVASVVDGYYYCDYITSISGGLVYKPLLYDEEYAGDIADEPIELNVADFNRTPMVGETFPLYVYASREDYGVRLFPMSVYTVGQTTITAKTIENNSVQLTSTPHYLHPIVVQIGTSSTKKSWNSFYIKSDDATPYDTLDKLWNAIINNIGDGTQFPASGTCYSYPDYYEVYAISVNSNTGEYTLHCNYQTEIKIARSLGSIISDTVSEV